MLIIQDSDCPAAGSRINTDHLLVPTELTEGNLKGHQVQVKATLRVLTGTAELQEIEHRLNVSVEPVITLTSKRSVSPSKLGNRFPGVAIEFSCGGDAIASWDLAVVALIVKGRGVSLIVRRNHTGT